MVFTVFSKVRRRVFISHCVDREDEVHVCRLQDLAAAIGIHVYVPRTHSYQRTPSDRIGLLRSEVEFAIDRSPFVFAVITSPIRTPLENEIGYALGRKKLIVPLVEVKIERSAFLRKLPRVFRFSRGQNPDRVAAEVVEWLKAEELIRKHQRDVEGLIGIALALLSESA